MSRAFSSEVETGSRQENVSNQESRAPFRFNRNGKGLGPPRLDRHRLALAAVVGRAFARGDDADGVFLDSNFAVPAVAERDAANVGEVDAVVDLAVEVEGAGSGDVEDVQGDEIARTAPAVGGNDDE